MIEKEVDRAFVKAAGNRDLSAVASAGAEAIAEAAATAFSQTIVEVSSGISEINTM